MTNSIYVRDPFREFDTLIRRAFAPVPSEPALAGFVPAVETYRDGDDAVIRLELPGVDVANDVNVEVVGRRLVVSGERRDERTEGRRLREFRYGSFKRAFRLAPHVTAESVSASYDAGVLSVRVTGAYAETPGQRIAIKTSEPVAVEATPAEEASPEA